MIMPENLNKNLEQKSYTECVTHENYNSAFPAHPSAFYCGPEPRHPPFRPPPSPPPPPKKKSDSDSLSKYNY